MKLLLLFITAFLCSTFLSAQKITISGFVKDDATKEAYRFIENKVNSVINWGNNIASGHSSVTAVDYLFIKFTARGTK